jgi:hypothetical protein
LKTILQTWRKFWRSSAYDRNIAFRAASALIATRAGLRLGGFRRWKALLSKFTPKHMRHIDAKDFIGGELILGTAPSIARMGEAVARSLPFKPTCLEKSLVLWWLLRRHRIPADLRIGVRKDVSGDFEAHAWVEADGVILGESGEDHALFVPLEGAIQSHGTQSR